jgi:putative ABC transport system permease protein
MALPFRYNVLSLRARPTSTLSSIGLIAVVIAAFCYLQAVTDSAFQMMAGSGDPNTIIVMAQAAQSETVSALSKDSLNKLQGVPVGVRRGTAPLISAELVGIAGASMPDDPSVTVNAAVRGVDFELASAVRHGRVRIVAGRLFQPGAYEVIVGATAARTYRNFGLDGEILLGSRGIRPFKVVGIFTTDGTAADSEVWGYVETLRDLYSRTGYSSARMLVNGEQEGRELIRYIEGPEVELTASTERDYFRELNTNQTVTQYLSVAMIVIMGIAAAFAVANTMYAAVAGRTREIGMLRAIGFGRTSILNGFLLEGLLLSLGGGLLGCGLSMSFNGAQRNMLPTTFTTVGYTLQITPKIVGVSLAVALGIGLAGSLAPAWRAARLNLVSSLREA